MEFTINFIIKFAAASENVLIFPSTVIQTEAVVAHFHCQVNEYVSVVSIIWMIGGVPLSERHRQGVSIVANGRRGTITIPARAEFNETTVQCGRLYYDTGYYLSEWSHTADLKIQGM